MKSYDIFAKPLGGDCGSEFLALSNYSGDLDKVFAMAKDKGCEITRIYNLGEPVNMPNFAKCVNI